MKKNLFFLNLLVGTLLFGQNQLVGAVGKSGGYIFLDQIASLDLESNGSESVMKADPNQKGLHFISALALDVSGEQTLFVPMFSSNVYAIDLKTKTQTLVYGDAKEDKAVSACDIGLHYTRMASTPDGNSYAINNDATSVLEISSLENRFLVKDLGALTNDSSNGEHSLYEQKYGFGGDLISDEEGQLYLISAFNHIYSISLEDMKAKYIGAIQGLPEDYTSNGAAVLADGKVVIGNAKGDGYYQFSWDDKKAEVVDFDAKPIYDLASPYFLRTEKGAEFELVNNENIGLYPTLIRTGEIKVNATMAEAQRLNVSIYDIHKTSVFEQQVSGDDISSLNLNKLRKGVYLVRVEDAAGNLLKTEKVIVK